MKIELPFKFGDNDVLVIQTADSSSIIVTRDEFPYDSFEEGDSDLQYSIREGDNPRCWCDNWHREFESIINIIEMPPQGWACRGGYISWWLNCRPTFIDESVSMYLKKRLQLYHKMGEIEKAFRYSKFGLEAKPDCLMLWHHLLEVSINPKLMTLIPNDRVGKVEVPTITVIFDGFNNIPFTGLYLKTRPLSTFQHLLDYIYGCIGSTVNPISYGSEWILINQRSGEILRKAINPLYKIDNRTLNAVGIKEGDRLICKLA